MPILMIALLALPAFGLIGILLRAAVLSEPKKAKVSVLNQAKALSASPPLRRRTQPTGNTRRYTPATLSRPCQFLVHAPHETLSLLLGAQCDHRGQQENVHDLESR